MIELNLSGYTDLPAGKIGAIVTHLEMTERPQWRRQTPDDVALEAVEQPDVDWYRLLFREIGEDWLWFSRLLLADGELEDILKEPDRQVWRVSISGRDSGLLELNFADPANAEIAFFGLTPSATGRSLGSWLMGEALNRCWSRPGVERVWLHTCTLDHPRALPFYLKCGFRAHRRSIEVMDDPRLHGKIKPDAASHHPMI